MPRLDRDIQYVVASLLNHARLGVTGSPGQAGRRQRWCGERIPRHCERAKQSRIPPRKDSGLPRCARNDGARGGAIALQFTFQTADTRSPSRGACRPSFASGAPSRRQGRREGRAPAGTRVRARQNAHGVDHRCCRSPGLPCANGFNGVLRALLGERCTIAPVALRMIDARAGRPPHLRKP